MHFFVSRELFIANTLSRHFSWSHNVLFQDDLPRPTPAATTTTTTSSSPPAVFPFPPTAVVLSSADAIVPAPDTLAYLVRNGATQIKAAALLGDDTSQVQEQEQDGDDGGGARGELIEVAMLEGVQHGEMMLYPKVLDAIQRLIEERCGLQG
jgi:hypothetical protein